MMSVQQQQQISQTNEDLRARKLGPIYNALDSGNWKQALKLCEKKEIERWPVVKALKASALIRQGRRDEALHLCAAVRDCGPTDYNTLKAMQLNYRMMDDMGQYTALVEKAVAQRPGDSDLLSDLFSCYIRDKAYLKAQQTATRLYKLKGAGASKYIMWAGAVMLIQVRRGGSPTLLMLAERMVEKTLKESKESGQIITGEGMMLYLDILREQGKHSEALGALRELLGEAADEQTPNLAVDDETSLDNGTIVTMQYAERKEVEASLLRKLGQAQEATEVFAELLRRTPDQWSYYLAYIDLSLSHVLGGTEEGEEGGGGGSAVAEPALVWTEICKAQKHIKQLQSDLARPFGLRGPYLAELELLLRALKALGPQAELSSDWAETETGEGAGGGEGGGSRATCESEMVRLVMCYFDAFCGKLCCLSDLRPYLAVFLGGQPMSKGSGEGDSNSTEQLNERRKKERQQEEQLGLSWEGMKGGREQLLSYFEGVARETRHTQAAPDAVAAGASPDKSSSSSGSDGSSSSDGINSKDPKAQVRRLLRYIRAMQGLRFLGHCRASCASMDELRRLASELVQQYRDTLCVNDGAEGGQREVQHGDELALLAAHVLRDIRGRLLLLRRRRGGGKEEWGGEEAAYLINVEVAALLEYAIRLSPFNYQFKLLAIQVYKELGAFKRALELEQVLDIKQVQLDSLSWVFYPGALSCGFFGEAYHRSRAILNLHKNFCKDSADFIQKAFTQGNYSKAMELVSFQEHKMEKSLQLMAACAEKSAIEMLLTHHSLSVGQDFLSSLVSGRLSEQLKGMDSQEEREGLRSNMDYGARIQWDCPLEGGQTAATSEARRRDDKLRARILVRKCSNECLLMALQGTCAIGELQDALHALRQALIDSNIAVKEGVGPSSNSGSSSSSSSSSNSNSSSSKGPEGVNGGVVGGKGVEVGAVRLEEGGRNLEHDGWDMLLELMWATGLTARAFKSSASSADEEKEKGGVTEEEREELMAKALVALASVEGQAKQTRDLLMQGVGKYVCVLGGDGEEEGGKGPDKARAAELKRRQKAVPLSPAWLAALSKWVLNTAPGVCLLLQSLAVIVPAPSKKKKGKKTKKKGGGGGGGGGGDAAGGDGGPSPAERRLTKAGVAISSLGSSVLALLATIATVAGQEVEAKGTEAEQAREGGGGGVIVEVMLRRERSASRDGTPPSPPPPAAGGGAGGEASAYDLVLGFLGEQEKDAGAAEGAAAAAAAGTSKQQQQQRRRTSDVLGRTVGFAASGQAASGERLKEVVKDKIAALQQSTYFR